MDFRTLGLKRRPAHEYDAAQERGEVRKDGQRGKAVPEENSFSPATAAEVDSPARKFTKRLRLVVGTQREPCSAEEIDDIPN